MPLTCNQLAAFNTVGTTQNIAACKAPHVANVSDHELLSEQFLLLVLDGLRRTLPTSWTALQAAPACDLSTALRFASCAMLTNTPQFPITVVDLQAQILFMLNDALCGP